MLLARKSESFLLLYRFLYMTCKNIHVIGNKIEFVYFPLSSPIPYTLRMKEGRIPKGLNMKVKGTCPRGRMSSTG
jgi:hypothetical protein